MIRRYKKGHYSLAFYDHRSEFDTPYIESANTKLLTLYATSTMLMNAPPITILGTFGIMAYDWCALNANYGVVSAPFLA